MKRQVIFSILLSFVVTQLASAHGSSYFSFQPDVSQGLYLSQVSNPVQLMLPQNEYLGGIDLWVDNSGSAGQLDVQLRTSAGQLLATGIASVPHIDPVSGGQKIHIDFGSQPAVVHNQVYRLSLTSALPDLRLYYGDRIFVVEHNAPQASAYLNGVAEINGEEKEFSFKFALYEYSESKAPVIIDHVVNIINQSQARIDFHVNESVDYKISYGISGGASQEIPYTGTYSYCGVIACSITLNTDPSTNYNYTFTVKDIWGNSSNVTGSFLSGGWGPTSTPTPTTTASAPPSPTPDVVPPVITNLRIVEVTASSVQVAWTTDEAANGLLVVQSLPGPTNAGYEFDELFELEHNMIVSDITPETLYIAKITSGDSFGNESQATLNFSTPSNLPTPSANPSQTPTSSATPIPEPEVQEGDDGQTTISWTGGGSGDVTYRIDIFDENNNLIESRKITGDTKLTTKNFPKGARIVVYEEKENGTFEKKFVSKNRSRNASATEKLFEWLANHILYVAIAGLALIVGLWVLLKKLQKNQKPPSSPPTLEVNPY